jgi:hypothetical protein
MANKYEYSTVELFSDLESNLIINRDITTDTLTGKTYTKYSIEKGMTKFDKGLRSVNFQKLRLSESDIEQVALIFTKILESNQ